MFNFIFSSKERKLQKRQQKIQKERCKPWFKIKGDKTLRLNYNLSESSIVLDLGGYKGDFAQEIYNRYNSEIHIFEPVSSFFSIIENRFKNNSKIKAYPFGLSDVNKELYISNSADASSVFLNSDSGEKITLKSIIDFLDNNKINSVDLIKINTEGGEYEVLESLIKSNKISIFKNLQIQFHDFIIENAKQRMENIQMELAKTHEITYKCEFVWENWKLKSTT